MPANSKESLYAQLPITKGAVYIKVYESNGDESAYRILNVIKVGLHTQFSLKRYINKDIRNFVEFAQQFCINAGVIPTYTNRLYVSDNGKFKIRYSKEILDDGFGGLTPARIVADRNDPDFREIEVSQHWFLQMTVPQRFFTLTHEFSHGYLNVDIFDELEADLNGLAIGLGHGYPRIEAHETYLGMFDKALTEENKYRYEQVADFIDNFDKLNFAHL